MEKNRWIHAFSCGIKEKLNAISLVQDLGSSGDKRYVKYCGS